MISRTVFEDKLPEDKVKYYNKTRMSLDLFCRTVGVAEVVLLRDLEYYGYHYYPDVRKFVKLESTFSLSEYAKSIREGSVR